MIEKLFEINLIVQYLMLSGIVYSIIRPTNRIWPPPKQQSWQFYGTWILFYLGAVLTTILALFTWNTWVISAEIRFFIGVPLALLGGAFVSWGIVSLGIKNTHGSANGFVDQGAYQFTRNPQYLGDIILFIGLSMVANSLYVTIPLLLQAIIFVITPFSEELWLKEQYGNRYTEYRNRTSRFM